MKKRRWIKWAGAGLVLAVIAAGFIYRSYLIDYLRFRTKFQTITDRFDVGERTLIVAPHPDDETLGGAGVIEKAIAAGKKVKVVILTAGDGYERAVIENLHVVHPKAADYRKLGELRHLESLAAMKHFGVKQEDVIFLGYPDGGINGMWESDWDYDRLHRGLNGGIRSPYTFSYEKEAPYCGANVAKNLTDILRNYKPTDVVYPDPNDQHHDHWATNAFVKYILTEQNYQAREWTYLVHRGDYPVPWKYEPKSPLHPPYVLSGLDTHWIPLPMNQIDRQSKLDAIHQYATQTKVMDPFLVAFVRSNDLVGTYKDPTLPIQQGSVQTQSVNKLPYTVFLDAFSDTLQREMEGHGDITAVAAVRSDHGLHVGIETRNSIQDQLMYNLRLRIFRPDGIKRMDITAHGSKLSAVRYASNSLELPKGAVHRVNDRQLWVDLPSDVLDGATSLMLCADSFKGSERIDKTAWRLLRVIH